MGERLRYTMAGDIRPNFSEPGLVDGLLDMKGMTIVYGRSGAGKTAVVVDLACRIAAGADWRTLPCQAGLVLYVAAENSESTRRRVWAWCREHSDEPIPLAVVESPITMGNGAVEAIAELADELAASLGQPCRMVVLDTLARTMAGDENTAKDMGAYVKALDDLKDRLSCQVLVVHHTGKDEARGPRGSSTLRAATDHEIEVEKDVSSRVGTVTLTKVREGDLEGQRFGFHLKQHLVGRNKLGRDITAITAEACEAPSGEGKAAGAAARAREYIEAEGGRVTLEELKEAVGVISSGKADSEQKAWRRLITKHLVELPGGYIGLPD